MTRRRKKAWGPSNALWRWQHRHSRRRASISHVRHRRRSGMARYRRHRRFGRSRGGKSFFGLSTRGPVLPAMGLLGIGAAYLFGDAIGSMIPVVNEQSQMIKSAAGGFILGGPAGAVVGIAKGFLGNGSSSFSGGW